MGMIYMLDVRKTYIYKQVIMLVDIIHQFTVIIMVEFVSVMIILQLLGVLVVDLKFKVMKDYKYVLQQIILALVQE